MDFSSAEFAQLAADNSYSVEAVAVVNEVFEYICTFDMVDRWYNKEDTFNLVFTSNKTPSQWKENFKVADALLCSLDRIFDDALVFNIRSESFRGKRLEHIALQAGTPYVPMSTGTVTS